MKYSFVTQQLVQRELKRKYSRSRLGILWSVLNPLLSMAVLSLVFSTMFRKSIENYPVYYLTGLILWNFFTGATNAAMTSLADNRTLLLQTRFPRAVFPLSRVLASFVNFLYSLAAYAVILAVFSIRPAWTMALFVPIVALLGLFVMGVGFLLSILYAYFGDIRHLYGVLLTLWMYLSALFYPVSLLPEAMQKVIGENPIYCYIAAARDCMMYGQVPPAGLWARMVLWAVFVFWAGSRCFSKNQGKIIQSL